MQISAIHQFSPSFTNGDGVSNGMIFTRKLLRDMGFLSEIYCEFFPEELSDQIRPLAELSTVENDILMVHHSLGYVNCQWIEQQKARKVIVYHNITPAEFLPDNGLRELSQLGKEQLTAWANDFVAAIGDSDFNCDELRRAHYEHVESIPLLVDIEQMSSTAPEIIPSIAWHECVNLVFVGRFCENKNQLRLVQFVKYLQGHFALPVRLFLAGGVTSEPYKAEVEQFVNEHGLKKEVILLGKISNANLVSLFRNADAYLSFSLHEGFGMPLIEAMLYDLPVLAFDTTGISSTLGNSGVLINPNSDFASIAQQLKSVLLNAPNRRAIIRKQRENLRRFSYASIRTKLEKFLQQIQIEIPNPLQQVHAGSTQPSWQIEGPYDSSYSLAIVNRELARGFQKIGQAVALRSHEGHGDFMPNAQVLVDQPDLAVMADAAQKKSIAHDVAMRFCYPPHTDDMPARIKVLHSYCWEETGFPNDYVEEFNQRLDLITVASHFVKKVLRDSGVVVPIAVTGLGVDHLLATVAQVPDQAYFAQTRRFRFLHISSCFPRKGVDVLLAAYGAAFRLADDVSLTIKTFANPHNTVEELLAALRQNDPDFPHVVLIKDDYTNEQIKGLYESSHAVVVPSRGEGFGLPIAEAMLCGLPVITTACSGQADFVNQDNAWICDYDFAMAGSHLSTSHSAWVEPRYRHLAQLMRELFEAPTAGLGMQMKIQRAKKDVLEKYTWANSARLIRQAVEKIERQSQVFAQPKIGWISSLNARCGVASYSAFLSTEIPADRLIFLANHTAERVNYDAANVLRTWSQDMEEDLHYVILEIIERDIRAVVIQYNFGFFSLSVLSAFILKMRELGIQTHIFFHSTADVKWVDRDVSLSTIKKQLKVATRLYVHGVDDLNRLDRLGLQSNVVLFPQGLMRTPMPAIANVGKVEKVIAAYGFLLPHKGMLVLIQAVSLLAKRGLPVRLNLVTSLYPIAESRAEVDRCHSLIHQLGLTEQVSIRSDYLADNESLRLLQQADLIVYPYQATQESSSAAVRMGLASGCPVAVTPLSIFDDVAQAVHQLPGTSAEEIAQGIADLFSDSETMAKKRDQARAWVAARQWPSLSRRLVNIIDGLANEIDFSDD